MVAMARPQFSIQTLLWLTLVVAAFFGGMGLQFRIDEEARQYDQVRPPRSGVPIIFDPGPALPQLDNCNPVLQKAPNCSPPSF